MSAAAAVLYEVNLEVDRDVADDFVAWLRAHVAQMLSLPGFLGVQVHDVLDPLADDGRIGLCLQYRMRDMGALHAYLRDHSAGMRADGIARFGDRFRASRRVLRLRTD